MPPSIIPEAPPTWPASFLRDASSQCSVATRQSWRRNCTLGATFDCDSRRVHVRGGCRGIFWCGGTLVPCGKRHAAVSRRFACGCDAAAADATFTTAINPMLVAREAVQVLRLDVLGLQTLRYFSLIGSAEDGLWLVARIDLPKRAAMPRTTLVDFASVLLSLSPRPRVGHAVLTILHDYSLSHNLVVRQHEGKLYAVGGQATFPKTRELKADPRVRNDLRDGVRLLRAESIADLRAGQWHAANRSALPRLTSGRHPGCVSRLRSGVPLPRCEYDGKLGLVRHRAQWLLYARANTKPWGGRFVQVAASTTDDVAGPYGQFRRLSIKGYDEAGDANIYFAAVEANPLDERTLLGLFPVNLGEAGKPNGNGEAFIAIALSCDGLHWSELTPLVWSVGIDGRTLDHPVDGLVADRVSGDVSFWLARDASGVNNGHRTNATSAPRLVRYALRADALREMTRRVVGRNVGC